MGGWALPLGTCSKSHSTSQVSYAAQALPQLLPSCGPCAQQRCMLLTRLLLPCHAATHRIACVIRCLQSPWVCR